MASPSTASSWARSARTATSCAPSAAPPRRRRRSGRRRRHDPARARADGRDLRGDPRHALALGPPRRRRRPRRGTGATVYGPESEAHVLENPDAFYAGSRSAPWQPDTRSRAARRSSSPASTFEASPFPATRRGTSPTTRTAPLLRRRALRRLGRPHRPAVRRLGHAARVDPDAGRPLPARDRRLLRATARRRRSAPSSPRNPFLAELRALKFEAPRGTHDILPSEQPLWRQVIDEFERLCALYGYRRIQTPVFEDTELFVRTSGEGSDVVSKEMYTFEDRGDRSLTLRAEATAPIVPRLPRARHAPRAPARRSSTRTRRSTATAARRRAASASTGSSTVEAIGSDDPAVDAEVIQLYDALLRRLGVTDYRLELNSIGDPNCRPAYLERLEAVARRARRRARRGDARAGRAQPAARARQHRRQAAGGAGGARAGARRSATRSATPAASTSPRCAATSTRTASATSSCRRSSAGSTTTRARPGSSSGRRAARSDALRRRPLRRARRGARRPAHAGRRLRRGDRAAAPRARGRRRDARAARASTSSSSSRRAPTARPCSPSCRAARGGLRPTPTTPAAR